MISAARIQMICLLIPRNITSYTFIVRHTARLAYRATLLIFLVGQNANPTPLFPKRHPTMLPGASSVVSVPAKTAWILRSTAWSDRLRGGPKLPGCPVPAPADGSPEPPQVLPDCRRDPPATCPATGPPLAATSQDHSEAPAPFVDVGIRHRQGTARTERQAPCQHLANHNSHPST